MLRYFWRALLVCGLLDIGFAAALTLANDGTVDGMLRSIASGPFGKAASGWGLPGAVLGLAVHFAIMAAMVTAFALLVRRTGIGRLSPWISGIWYGGALYIVMYWIVLPLRWPSLHPSTDAATVAPALIAHIVLVGLPMAFFARRLSCKGVS